MSITIDVRVPMRALPFGRKVTHRPSNVAKLKPIEIISFVRDALRGAPEVALIESRVNHDTGRPRRLSVDVLFAAGVAQAASEQSNLHVRSIAATLRSLGPGDQRLLGVRWVDPHGRGEQVITERQVAYLFEEIAVAFSPDLHRHNHTFLMDDNLISSAGEFLGSLEELSVSDPAAFGCPSSCPHYANVEQVNNLLLARLWEYTKLPFPDSLALDSAVIETHYVTRGFGPRANIDPNWVQDVDEDLADRRWQIRQDKSSKSLTAGTRKYIDDLLANPEPLAPRDPRSRAPIAAGPVVKGDFTVMDPRFPQLGPDGRLQWTFDEGARNAYRGGGSFRQSQILDGRDDHKLASSGRFPDGTPYPPLAAAYHVVPGGDDKGAAALSVFELARANGVGTAGVTLDRIYTDIPGPKFEHLANEHGWNLTRDLKTTQRVAVPWQPGVTYLDGMWFTDGMPPGLVDIQRPSMNARREERQASQRRFDERRPFMFRNNGVTTTGGLKLRGPAVPDQVFRDAKGRVTGVRGVRARCVNSPYARFINRRDVPASTACVQGERCGCSLTFIVPKAEVPSSHEPLLWGSSKWAKVYFRRNLSEAEFSVGHYHYGLGRHSIRVHAKKWDLAFAMVVLATWIRQFHSLVMKQGAYALDSAYYSGFDPDVIEAAIAILQTPSRARRGRANDPPT